jgi:hypothetical protein
MDAIYGWKGADFLSVILGVGGEQLPEMLFYQFSIIVHHFRWNSSKYLEVSYMMM